MKNSANLYPIGRASFRFLLIVMIFGFFSGCFHYYYKVTEQKTLMNEDLNELQTENKNFILHMGDSVFGVNNLKIQNEILTGSLNPLSLDKQNELLILNREASKRYFKNKERNTSDIVDDVHFYVNEPIYLGDSVIVPLNSITKVEIFSKDKGATLASWIGPPLMVGLVATIIIVSSSGLDEPPPPPPTSNGEYSSCPFIYTNSGDSYSFEGEVYGGAILKSLERHDYLCLPDLETLNNNYHLYFTNQAKEIQHTNLVELWVVDHSENSKVFIDKYGNPYPTSDIKYPDSAIDSQGKSHIQEIKEADNQSYFAVPDSNNHQSKDELILIFSVPENCREGKLVLRARNSLLVDYSFAKFTQMFGDNYPKWQKIINKKSADELNQWSMDQNIPLSVYVEENGVWKFTDYFNPPGPIAFRDDVMKINLSGSTEKYEVKIKLGSGRLFWEIDRVGMDFSPNYNVSYTVLRPYQATDQNAVNVLDQLLYDDKNYLDQPEIGDETEIVFHAPVEKQELNRTIFLHSKGYYTIIGNNNKGKSLVYMSRFNKPQRFTRFVHDNYFKILEARTE